MQQTLILTTAAMETLFRPSDRWQAPNHRPDHLPDNLTEIELLPGLTIENIRATGVTWEDLHRFLRGKLVWMTPDVYIFSQYTMPGGIVVLHFLDLEGADSRYPTLCVRVAPDTLGSVATATCDFLLHLMATTELGDVCIRGCGRNRGVPPPLSGAGLSLFFHQSRDDLQEVSLCDMALNADQIHALATVSRPTLEVMQPS
jgi:hypothetical protein